MYLADMYFDKEEKLEIFDSNKLAHQYLSLIQKQKTLQRKLTMQLIE